MLQNAEVRHFAPVNDIAGEETLCRLLRNMKEMITAGAFPREDAGGFFTGLVDKLNDQPMGQTDDGRGLV